MSTLVARAKMLNWQMLLKEDGTAAELAVWIRCMLVMEPVVVVELPIFASAETTLKIGFWWLPVVVERRRMLPVEPAERPSDWTEMQFIQELPVWVLPSKQVDRKSTRLNSSH